jgi:hypothetical protein
MRSKISVFLIVGFVVSLCALTTLAQEEEKEPELVFVREFTVKPSMRAQFVETTKIWATTCKEHNFSRSWYAWHDGDFHYYYFVPVKDYGDIDSFSADYDATMENLGEEELQEIDKKFFASIDSFNDYFIWSMPKFSYVPENPRLKEEEQNYAIWDMLYSLPGKKKEIEELSQKLHDLLKSKNYNDEVYIFAGDIGTERPVYIGVLYGKDAADFWTQNEKMWELLGEEGENIFQKWMSLLRKRDFKQFWYSPDLSYTPKEK